MTGPLEETLGGLYLQPGMLRPIRETWVQKGHSLEVTQRAKV